MAVAPHLPPEFEFADEERKDRDLSLHPDVDLLTDLLVHADPREVARAFVDLLPDHGVAHVIGRLNRSAGHSTLDHFQEGEVVQGIVVRRHSTHYLVDVYGARGLLAIPGDSHRPGPVLLEEGDVIHPIVLRVDPRAGVLALELRHARNDPWDGVWLTYPLGRHVEARVIQMGERGVTVKLENGIFGRVEIDETRETDRRLQLGDVVQVRIAGYHGEDREILVRLVESCCPRTKPMQLLRAYPVNGWEDLPS